MIEVVRTSASDREALTASERHGLDVLLDLSRVLRVDFSTDCVRVAASDAKVEADLAGCLAADWHFEVSDGMVRIPRSVLRLITSIVGAVEEQRSEVRDRFGRVTSRENALARMGKSDDPIIARAAVRLREAVIRAAGGRMVILARPWPQGRRWAVALTHDLDVVSWWPGFTALRIVELLRKAQLGLAARAGLAALGALVRSPIEAAAGSVLDLELRRTLRSTWFILCGTPTLSTMAAGDLTYRPESKRARRILQTIEKAGHEIGLHGSFATYDRAEVFGKQRARLDQLVNRPTTGVRQHFLRMVPGATQRAMADAGFRYDSTFGFADRNGFRLGVADVVPMWDEHDERALPIEEAPFCWMDRALSKYQGIEDPTAWVEDGLRIAGRVQETNGLWVGIWHPNLDTPLGYPHAIDGFSLLLARLADQQPHFMTLAEAVNWRVARRETRVRGVRPDGTVDLATKSGGVSIDVEHPDGTAAAGRMVQI